MGQNNHEIFSQLRDTSDGKGADGVQHPDLKAKSDTGAVSVDTTALKKRIASNDRKLTNGDDPNYNKTLKTVIAQTDTLETARGHNVSKLPEYKNTKRPNVKPK
jgi:microcystin-dependent protein